MKKSTPFFVGILSILLFLSVVIYMPANANAASTKKTNKNKADTTNYQPMDGMDSATYPTQKVTSADQASKNEAAGDTVAASYPYLIKVNKRMNTVTIYAKNSK